MKHFTESCKMICTVTGEISSSVVTSVIISKSKSGSTLQKIFRRHGLSMKALTIAEKLQISSISDTVSIKKYPKLENFDFDTSNFHDSSQNLLEWTPWLPRTFRKDQNKKSFDLMKCERFSCEDVAQKVCQSACVKIEDSPKYHPYLKRYFFCSGI